MAGDHGHSDEELYALYLQRGREALSNEEYARVKEYEEYQELLVRGYLEQSEALRHEEEQREAEERREAEALKAFDLTSFLMVAIVSALYWGYQSIEDGIFTAVVIATFGFFIGGNIYNGIEWVIKNAIFTTPESRRASRRSLAKALLWAHPWLRKGIGMIISALVQIVLGQLLPIGSG